MKIARTRRELGGFVGASLVAVPGMLLTVYLVFAGQLQGLTVVAVPFGFFLAALAGFVSGSLASLFSSSRHLFALSAVASVASGLAGVAAGGTPGALIGVAIPLALGGCGAIVVAICNRVFPEENGPYRDSSARNDVCRSSTLDHRDRNDEAENPA